MTETLHYLNPDWHDTLTANQLVTFDQFWNLQLDAVDEGNTGRGQNGWSRVSIHRLNSPAHKTRRIVIKRQNNYRSRTVCHPLRGISTFVKEYNFIQLYKKLGVPAMTAVYCATRQMDGNLQSILVTEYLEGYQSLFDLLQQPVTRHQKAHYIASVASLVAILHEKGLEHRCLFPKHIFVADDIAHSARLIDLEKTRGRPWSVGRRVRDLAALGRRTRQVPVRDRVSFFRQYLGLDQLDQDAKKLWRHIEQRMSKKTKQA